MSEIAAIEGWDHPDLVELVAHAINPVATHPVDRQWATEEARATLAALAPTVERILAAAFDEGYVQAVRDHKMRGDDEAMCGWPTSPNPYEQGQP